MREKRKYKRREAERDSTGKSPQNLHETGAGQRRFAWGSAQKGKLQEEEICSV